ncbi:hypothetical protein SLA2020_514720 [Shorea laevis]
MWWKFKLALGFEDSDLLKDDSFSAYWVVEILAEFSIPCASLDVGIFILQPENVKALFSLMIISVIAAAVPEVDSLRQMLFLRATPSLAEVPREREGALFCRFVCSIFTLIKFFVLKECRSVI